MMTIDSIETKGLETVIKLSLNGKSQTRTYDVLQAGEFLSSLGDTAVAYKNRATLSNATALRNAYNKKIKTLDVKVGPVEAKVKIKTPENNNTVKINAENSVSADKKENRNTKSISDTSETLKKLRIYINQKTQDGLKTEQERLEKFRQKLAEDVKKLAHISGVEYEYARSKSNRSGNVTESITARKTQDFTKFSIPELKKMKKKLSLKIERQDKISKFKAEEQTKRKYKLIESRYKTLIENEEKLNALLNERESQVIDIIDVFSELKQDSNYFVNSGIKTKKDSLYIFLILLFCIACIAGLRYERRLNMQKDIAEKIVRFHVIANSDRKADQDLKLAVRDAVGIKMSELLKDVTDRSESEDVIRENMENMKQTAQKVIAENGYDYEVDVCLKDTDFPVKSYGMYTFPAGTYEALEIVIGEGKGHNWWCVMYPNMCFSDTMYEVISEDAKSSLKRVLSEDEYQQVLASGNYQVRFRGIEILKELYDEK